MNFYTHSKWKAFKIASLSGLAEPLGVIIVGKLSFFYAAQIKKDYILQSTKDNVFTQLK